jgi:hypothetical protein
MHPRVETPLREGRHNIDKAIRHRHTKKGNPTKTKVKKVEMYIFRVSDKCFLF